MTMELDRLTPTVLLWVRTFLANNKFDFEDDALGHSEAYPITCSDCGTVCIGKSNI